MNSHTTQSGSILTVDGATLTIRTASGKQITQSLGRTARLSGKAADAVRSAGKDPADYRGLPGTNYDLAAADWIDAQYEALEQRREADRRNPVNIARSRVNHLFARAERRIDYPGEYYPMLSGARAALAAWRAQYPDAARAEDRQELLDEARDLQDLATGALLYDADGWLSREDQQRRHDEYLAQAAAKRAEAEAI